VSFLKLGVEKVIADTDETRRAISLELLSSVVLDTPLDTGRAKGNWQAGDSVISGEVNRLGDSGALEDINKTVSASNGDDTIFMTNNLPYIKRLEDGHSQNQAPQGMVKRNLARVARIVREKTK
jgi:hypothetical protein